MKCSECGKVAMNYSWSVELFCFSLDETPGIDIDINVCGKACLMKAIDREVDKLLGIRRVEGNHGT